MSSSSLLGAVPIRPAKGQQIDEKINKLKAHCAYWQYADVIVCVVGVGAEMGRKRKRS
jgi:hypothetical protein